MARRRRERMSEGKKNIISLYYTPLSKTKSALTSLFEEQKGSELENIYIVGDFFVNVCTDTCQNGDIQINQKFTISKFPDEIFSYKELTLSGFPFYSGSIMLEKKLDITDVCKYNKESIKIGVMNSGVGEVYVNGRIAGEVIRAPFECDITGLLEEGENRIGVKLYSTLRNTIGPFHNPRGDVGNLFGGGYENPHKSWMDTGMSQCGWENDLEFHNPKWTNDYILAPFGVSDITLILKK